MFSYFQTGSLRAFSILSDTHTRRTLQIAAGNLTGCTQYRIVHSTVLYEACAISGPRIGVDADLCRRLRAEHSSPPLILTGTRDIILPSTDLTFPVPFGVRMRIHTCSRESYRPLSRGWLRYTTLADGAVSSLLAELLFTWVPEGLGTPTTSARKSATQTRRQAMECSLPEGGCLYVCMSACLYVCMSALQSKPQSHFPVPWTSPPSQHAKAISRDMATAGPERAARCRASSSRTASERRSTSMDVVILSGASEDPKPKGRASASASARDRAPKHRRPRDGRDFVVQDQEEGMSEGREGFRMASCKLPHRLVERRWPSCRLLCSRLISVMAGGNTRRWRR